MNIADYCTTYCIGCVCIASRLMNTDILNQCRIEYAIGDDVADDLANSLTNIKLTDTEFES